VTLQWRALSEAMRHKRFASGLPAAPGAPTEAAGPDAEQSRRTATMPWRIRNPAERFILLSPRAIVGSLFSFEALLVLYMFAGMYKGDPRFAWIPVDPTGLFFALSVVVGGFIIVLNPIPKRAFPVIWAMLAFVTWGAVTLAWSPSDSYGRSKVFYLVTLALWGLIAAALIVAPNPERVRRLFTLLLLLAIWVGVEALLIYGPDRLFVGKYGAEYRPFGTYQHIGRAVGLGALIAFTAWLFGRRKSVVNLLFLVLFTGLAFVVTAAGGKGPVLESATAILLTLLLALRIARGKILYKRYGISIIWLVGALIAGLSVYIAATDHMPKSLQRLAGMVEGGQLQGTAASRAEMYEDVFEFWTDAPLLGHGAGSWPILKGYPEEWRSTPHNMFLEVLVESGGVGLVLLVALLVVALRPISVDRLRNDPLALCTFMLFIHEFLDAMLGGNIAEIRVMFMLLGLLTVFKAPRSASSRAVRPALAVSLWGESREAVASPSFGGGRKP
jgi:O-antigen ligase